MDDRHKIKVLFICKRRSHFYGPSFGLVNSCKFIVNALREAGIRARVAVVQDNNGIDAVVHRYRPSHVFIEALWVVPKKFNELLRLYPRVNWYVRIHSKVPFLANEGIAVEWLREYFEISKSHPNFYLAANSEETCTSFMRAFGIPIGYWPNIYHPECPYVEDDDDENCDCDDCDDCDGDDGDNHNHEDDDKIDIGCFGAIRPFKNQLQQAFAAITFGNDMARPVNFHINYDRCEQGGDTVLKNLRNSFKDTAHDLVLHPWTRHSKFIKLVKTMDLGLQVSYSETFNIVAADFADNGIPIVVSPEISWMDSKYIADPNKMEDIVDRLNYAWKGRKQNKQKANKKNLDEYNEKSTTTWLNQL